MVPGAGLEPARHFWRGILSPLCLPIPPPGHWNDNYTYLVMICIKYELNFFLSKKGLKALFDLTH